jgi:hypothetical protein
MGGYSNVQEDSDLRKKAILRISFDEIVVREDWKRFWWDKS